MAHMTLEQLKEENAKADKEAGAQPQSANEDLEAGAEDQGKPNNDGAAEHSDDDEGAKKPLEPWMQSDEDESDPDGHASDSDKKFTDGDVAAARRKMRAKLEKKHESEKEQLLKRIEDLENNQQKPAATVKPAAVIPEGTTAKPRREQFEDADDPDEAFTDALLDWKMSKRAAETDAKRKKDDQSAAAAEHNRQVEESVDSHYERAANLTTEVGISAERYQAADLSFRQMVETVFPGAGDVIADNLIANLGEGSERVTYNIGINAKRRQELQQLLQADKTGLKAAVYLGQLNAELSGGTKRTSKAPPPAADPQGDEKKTESFRALKRKYNAAHKAGDTQGAFDARREARQAGADTSSW